MTRTAQRLKAKNKKYRNEPNFPSNPMKGNPLAIQPSNPRATGGFASPQPVSYTQDVYKRQQPA